MMDALAHQNAYKFVRNYGKYKRNCTGLRHGDHGKKAVQSSGFKTGIG